MAASQEHGVLKLVATNARESLQKKIFEWPTRRFIVNNVGGTEYPENPKMADQPDLGLIGGLSLKKDWMLKLYFAPYAGDTIESEECFIQIPVQILDTSIGGKAEKVVLTGEDFDIGTTNFGAVAAVDLVTTTDQFSELGHYTVKEENLVMVGWGGNGKIPAAKAYIYIGDHD